MARLEDALSAGRFGEAYELAAGIDLRGLVEDQQNRIGEFAAPAWWPVVT